MTFLKHSECQRHGILQKQNLLNFNHIDSQFCLGTALICCRKLLCPSCYYENNQTSTCINFKKTRGSRSHRTTAHCRTEGLDVGDWCTKEELKVIRNIYIWRMKCSIRGSLKRYVENIAVGCNYFFKN